MWLSRHYCHQWQCWSRYRQRIGGNSSQHVKWFHRMWQQTLRTAGAEAKITSKPWNVMIVCRKEFLTLTELQWPTNGCSQIACKNALVVTRLDYCNSFYAELLQPQTVYCPIFTAAARFAHITTLLRLTYRCCACQSSKLRKSTLRSLSLLTLTIDINIDINIDCWHASWTEMNIKTLYGERVFAVAGSAAWNSLPAEIRLVNCFATFESQLKTYFFSLFM